MTEQGRRMQVDILISNYNYATYLGAAIDSALAQTHPDVRVIVVDDGSTDESRERLSEHSDRVEVVLKENGGQPSAMNAAMERSDGDVVIFLDADDRLRPEAAARVVCTFAADPDLVNVQFPMAVIDAEGTPTGESKPTGHLHPPTGDVRRAEVSFPFDLPWLPTTGNSFRADALARVFPLPERRGADIYPIHLTALLGTVTALGEVLAEYRVHGENAYEPSEARLDMDHVRTTIEFAGHTSEALERLADELGIDRPDPILSQSDVANRLISLRLEPQRHPIPGDNIGDLVVKAFQAAGRRFDIALPMKVLLVGFCLSVAVAPRRLVVPLAELFWFPERRRAVNSVLARLHRSPAREST